jgi:hypothetical protein
VLDFVLGLLSRPVREVVYGREKKKEKMVWM